MKLYNEIKLYLLAIFISILILNLKKKINIKILSVYLITSLLGIKTINCFINGNCFKEVWYFILIYVFFNILFIAYYSEFKKEAPILTSKLGNNNLIENDERKIKILNNVLAKSRLDLTSKVKKLKI
jgi:hypothetical protein